MIADTLKHLVEHDLTNHKEIQLITGRGASTVYRWLSGESEPQFHDVRLLVRQLKDPEARRKLVLLLSADLPVTIKWQEDERNLELLTMEGRREAAHEAIDASLLALECLTHLLSESREAMRSNELTTEAGTRIIDLSENAIRQLTVCKTTAAKLLETKKQARREE